MGAFIGPTTFLAVAAADGSAEGFAAVDGCAAAEDFEPVFGVSRNTGLLFAAATAASLYQLLVFVASSFAAIVFSREATKAVDLLKS